MIVISADQIDFEDLRDKKGGMHPEQIRIFRSMTPEQKLRLAFRLYDSARRLKAAGLRRQHPNWPEEEIAARVHEIFLNARP